MKKSSMENKVKNLPQDPGVYVFRGPSREILYIGKATNLRSRVQSYFRDGESERLIGKMMHKVADLEFHQTDSVLEALILESNLIKKHQPKYNIDLKDDKSFAYFVITKEEFPRVLIFRKTDLDFENMTAKKVLKYKYVFGPYLAKHQMETALKIIRRIFPFHALKAKTEKGCLDFQLGRCPGPYADAISKRDYLKNIQGIRMILEGKKKSLVRNLEKEMEISAKKEEFEKAAQFRNKIFALNHIRDVALMGREFDADNFENMSHKPSAIRIEAYDISNISGQNAVGSMVVFENGKPNKSEYRKFKIKSVEGSNDVGMMREVLARRIGNDWSKPDLVLLDGGQGHLNMAKELFETLGFAVSLASVAKGKSRKNLDIKTAFIRNTKYHMQNTSKSKSHNNNLEINKILQDSLLVKAIMDEAHRFAIGFHRKIRNKVFI